MEIKQGQDYRGWQLYEEDGHFYAYRHGVRMNTNSLEGIKTMIDWKIEDQLEVKQNGW